MLDAAIVGLGRWGQNHVNSVQGISDRLRFTRGVVRHPEKVADFGKVMVPGMDAGAKS